jgi:hypothetical protein
VLSAVIISHQRNLSSLGGFVSSAVSFLHQQNVSSIVGLVDCMKNRFGKEFFCDVSALVAPLPSFLLSPVANCFCIRHSTFLHSTFCILFSTFHILFSTINILHTTLNTSTFCILLFLFYILHSTFLFYNLHSTYCTFLIHSAFYVLRSTFHISRVGPNHKYTVYLR